MNITEQMIDKVMATDNFHGCLLCYYDGLWGMMSEEDKRENIRELLEIALNELKE